MATKRRRSRRHGPNKRWQADVDPLTFAERIRVWRIRRGLTQEELGTQNDLSKFFISLLETNRSLPSIETVSKIAATLDLTLDYLIDGRAPAVRRFLQVAVRSYGRSILRTMEREERRRQRAGRK